MERIDYSNSVFYYPDGKNQIRRYYTVEYLYDVQSELLNIEYREKLRRILEGMSIYVVYGHFCGKEFLESIGVYISNKEAVPYTIYFPANSDIDKLEEQVILLGKKYKTLLKPITAYVDIQVLMDKEMHGELHFDGKGKAVIPLNEDVIKPTDISDTASFMIDILLGLEAHGKKIIITDNYLFPESADAQYRKDLLCVLQFLGAKEIRCYGMRKSFDKYLFDYIKNSLNSIGTSLTRCEIEDFHDRFWINKDTLDGLVFGTSLNGIGKKLFYYDAITKEEAKIVLEYIGEV